MITFRIILLGLITVSSLNTPLLAVKQESSDVSKIQRMTRWVKSWRFPTKEDVRKVLKFLSHEEYVKCLKNRKKCSWKKVAALVALDAAIVAALIKGKKAFNAAKKSREEEIRKQKEKKALEVKKLIKGWDSSSISMPEKFKEVAEDIKIFRKDFVRHIKGVPGVLIPLWENAYRGNLDTWRRKFPEEWLLAKRFARKGGFGYSYIGMTAASHLLDEKKFKEVINHLEDTVGLVPTEGDRLMVELFEWEHDEPARREIAVFGRLRTEPRIRAEIFPPEIIKEIGTYLTPPPLLPPEEPIGSGKQEEEDET